MEVEKLEVVELSEEKIRELIERAIKSDKESEFILILEERNKLGEGIIEDYAYCNVVRGEADIIDIEKIVNYPIEIVKVAVIPRTVPVIIEYRKVFDDLRERHETLEYYVFTSEGWKKVTVYSY